MKISTSGRGPWPLPRMAALGAMLILPLAACDIDRVLEIDDPEFPGAGDVPAAAFVAGTLGEFQRAYSGAASNLHDEGYVSVSGALSDELYASGTFTTRIAIDERQPQPPAQGNITDAAYRWLHRSRRAARDAIADIQGAGTTTGAGLSQLHSIEAFTYVTLGEGFCGAVPFNEVVEPGFAGGPMLTTQQMFEGAVTRFDRGITAQPGSHLAAVGKGRALLNLGRYADAGAAVAAVPTDFIFQFHHSTNTTFQQNNVRALMDNRRWSQSDQEGGNGLPFRSAGDPRTPWIEDARGGFDDIVPMFTTLRYPTLESNMMLADGIEARLIQAEAALQTGGNWLGILNDLRANFGTLMAARYDAYADNLAAGVAAGRLQGTLAPLTDPGNMDGRVDMLFRERGFWLYLTGHRLGDLRRLARPVAQGGYGRPVGQVFPAGLHHLGNQYGQAVNFPVPFDEENNTNYDPAACVITQP